MENDDERKLAKRVTAVGAVKRTPAYIIAATRGVERPKTPDPYMRMSKRTWERGVMQWRKALREILHDIAVQTTEQEPSA